MSISFYHYLSHIDYDILLYLKLLLAILSLKKLPLFNYNDDKKVNLRSIENISIKFEHSKLYKLKLNKLKDKKTPNFNKKKNFIEEIKQDYPPIPREHR